MNESRCTMVPGAFELISKAQDNCGAHGSHPVLASTGSRKSVGPGRWAPAAGWAPHLARDWVEVLGGVYTVAQLPGEKVSPSRTPAVKTRAEFCAEKQGSFLCSSAGSCNQPRSFKFLATGCLAPLVARGPLVQTALPGEGFWLALPQSMDPSPSALGALGFRARSSAVNLAESKCACLCFSASAWGHLWAQGDNSSWR